jgi:hypothetical protein
MSLTASTLQVPGFTSQGSFTEEMTGSAASEAVRDAAMNVLRNISVMGASGDISFEASSSSVQVSSFPSDSFKYS